MIDPIANNEIGSSVRSKLNQVIEFTARGTIFKLDDQSNPAPVLQDDADLNFQVESGVSYLLRYALVFYEAGPNDHPKLSFGLPTISSATWVLEHQANGLGTPEVFYFNGTSLPEWTPSNHQGEMNLIQGWLRFSTTAAGTAVLKWCRGGLGTALMKEGSWMSICPADQVAS